MSPAPDPGEGQRLFFRGTASGVWVVTTRDAAGAPVGFTASSVASVALEPATCTLSLQEGSSSWPAVAHRRRLVVHALGADAAGLAARFATSGIDRFAGVAHTRDDAGLPVLPESAGVIGRLHVDVAEIIAVGGSRLLICRTRRAWAADAGAEPLVHHGRAYWRLAPAGGSAT